MTEQQEQSCPRCGAPLLRGARFCASCGRPLVAPAPGPAGEETIVEPPPLRDGAA